MSYSIKENQNTVSVKWLIKILDLEDAQKIYKSAEYRSDIGTKRKQHNFLIKLKSDGVREK